MKKDYYTIVDYFGPYPIDWEMYDQLRGIKPSDKIDLTIKRPYNINDIFEDYKKKINGTKNPEQ